MNKRYSLVRVRFIIKQVDWLVAAVVWEINDGYLGYAATHLHYNTEKNS